MAKLMSKSGLIKCDAYATSELGHERHFERAPGTSAIAPIATESLHCGKLPISLHRKLRAT